MGKRGSMKVLIVHDSKYGNGHDVAKAIASGLKEEGHEVDIVRAREIRKTNPAPYDAFIIGTPTHVGGPTFKTGRAIKHIGKNSSGKPYTTFTTWLNINQKTLTKMDLTAKKFGLEKLMDGKAFKVEGSKGPLEKGSADEAERFGKEMGKRLNKTD